MLRVLVVDDDFMVLSAMRKLLQGRHTVKTVTDGTSAVDAARSFRPDVVFIDLLLAYENGLDIVETLRPMLPSAHLVLMTYHPGEEIIHEAAASGADSFVGKEELPVVLILLDHLLPKANGSDPHR